MIAGGRGWGSSHFARIPNPDTRLPCPVSRVPCSMVHENDFAGFGDGVG